MSDAINAELRKALDQAAGKDLINDIVERELHDLVITDSPILNRIVRRSWPTNAYQYRQRTAGPTAFFAADGGDLQASSKSAFDKVSVPMRYIYSRVEVTGPMQYSVRDQGINLMAYEIENGARALSRLVEEKIVTGTGTGNEFAGLNVQITTNVKDLDNAGANGKLFLSHLDEAIDMPHRAPTTIIGGRAMGRRINALLQAQQRFIDRTEIDGGFQVMTYRGLPILTVDNLMVAGEGNPLAEGVFLIDHRQVHFVVQRETFVEKLAKVKDTDDYLVGMYATLAVVDENMHHAKIVNADFAVENA